MCKASGISHRQWLPLTLLSSFLPSIKFQLLPWFWWVWAWCLGSQGRGVLVLCRNGWRGWPGLIRYLTMLQKVAAYSTQTPLRTAQSEPPWHRGVLLSLMSRMPGSVTCTGAAFMHKPSQVSQSEQARLIQKWGLPKILEQKISTSQRCNQGRVVVFHRMNKKLWVNLYYFTAGYMIQAKRGETPKRKKIP